MRILLLNPPASEKVFREGRCEQKVELFSTSYPPLTLALLAGIFHNKYQVKIIDCIGLNMKIQKLEQEYKKFKPDKVFVSTSTPTIENDLKVIKHLYQIKKSEFLIYGVHATYFAKELSKLKYITVIKGEPEKYVSELVGEKFDFKKLKFPAWDLVDLSKYKLPLKNKRFVLINTSRGCYHECIFCTNPFFYKRKLQLRPVKEIIKEIEYIKNLGINDVLFFSDTFTLNNKWCKELCQEIIKNKLNISWICNSRVDTVDYSLLKLMKKAGLWLISFGIESGNQQILDKTKKKIKLKQVEKAVADARKANILTFGHFIFGLPGETKATIKQTIRFSKQLDLDFAMFYIATPFPGSELYQKHTKHMRQKSKWSKFEYTTQVIPSKINLSKWQEKAYKEFYLHNIPKRIAHIIQILGISKIPSIICSGCKTATHI